jgi:hypothetical protein
MTDLSPQARALIESAMFHEDLPSPGDLSRVRRAIVTGVAVGAAASAVSTTSLFAKAAAMAGGLAGQVTACAVVGAIAAGATLAVHERYAEERPSANAVAAARAKREPGAPPVAMPMAALPAAPPIATTSEIPSAERQPIAAPAQTVITPPRVVKRNVELTDGALPPDPLAARQPAASRESALPSETPAAAPAMPIAQATSARPPSADLARQLAYLHAMRAELRDGNAERALAMSRESEPLFAGSALYAESRAANIAALCRLARTSEARAEIARFRERFPSSVLLPTIEATCTSGEEGPRH